MCIPVKELVVGSRDTFPQRTTQHFGDIKKTLKPYEEMKWSNTSYK